MRIALVQLSAGPDKAANLRRAGDLTAEALRKRAHWALLPEMFNWRGNTADHEALKSAAEKIPGPSLVPFIELARRYKTAILAGSILEHAAPGKFYNTSVFINSKGQVAGVYRKMNLFDARLPQRVIQESTYLKAGRKKAQISVEGFVAGLSICYDLRFGGLYQWYRSRGTSVLAVPSCFTKATGQAHWEVLLRARAIENLSYVLAPNQTGTTVQGTPAYGNSMVVSPWGEVLARASDDKEEIVYADLDLREVAQARKKLPGIVKSKN